MSSKIVFTVEKFTKFAKTHQNMLFPAFQLQLHLQNRIMGQRFWERCSNRRIELSKGKFVTIAELMQLVKKSSFVSIKLRRLVALCFIFNLFSM